ncbi:MAG: PAS domain-containing protein [bacterium]|nr:PAS domain-containing protein [bacterium]
MSTTKEISLLGFVQTPILVGDPDGCIVYANPSFCDIFCGLEGDPVGQPLAMVFGGGAREAVLAATAEVLQRGKAARMQIREGGSAFTGLCSPIEAEDDRVGVVMVLLEEESDEEHLTGLADEIAEPIAVAIQAMHGLSDQLRGSLLEEQLELLDRGLHSIETAQKWMRELSAAIRGGKTQPGRFDVANSILRVSERISQESCDPIDFEVLMPPNLPRVAGTTVVFERLLTQLIRQRIEESREGQPLTLLARTIGENQAKSVLVSVVDVPGAKRRGETGLPPDNLQQGIRQMGGEAICVEDSTLGRVTAVRLALPSA